jgi:hypothetical protein
VALREKLTHDVYYAIRNGKGWNDTLLVITYDEHGGNYDHVPPFDAGTIDADESPETKMAGSEIEESAKAVQETAKATGKAIDAGRELGGFLRAVFGGSLEQLGGMLEDSLLMRRGVRRLRLIQRYNEMRIEMGLPPNATKPVSLKFGLPLIEAATLEDDDILQDMYARLLANATDPTSTIEAKRAFVSILQDCGPLEVRLLERICHAPDEGRFVQTARLPNEYLPELSGALPPHFHGGGAKSRSQPCLVEPLTPRMH